MTYQDFIRSKCRLSQDHGFEISDDEINPLLKPHQKAMVQWAVRGGRRAMFAAFGLGKTVCQLEAIRLTIKHAGGGRGLIVAPLGVRQEFRRDAERLGLTVTFIRSLDDVNQQCISARPLPEIYLTNYETVRDGKLDPRNFTVTSLDEAGILRGFGGSKTFREFMRLFDGLKYKFVATATPDPNEYIELLAYAAYLEIMDVGQAKTRFFKRDSTKADKLTIHPHKEREFWMWVASWALFLQRPSNLGYSDEGYDLPQLDVQYHEVKIDQARAGAERDGQAKMFRNATSGLVDAAREKRDSLPERVDEMRRILDASPEDHFLIWHDLEAERSAIEKAVPSAVTVYGSQPLDEREQAIIEFSEGKTQYLAAKPVMLGSGCNFQYHCHKAIFIGIGFKFNDWIQAVHRIQRFLQPHPVTIHLIYAESERLVLQNLLDKWERHKAQVEKMTELLKEYGLAKESMRQDMQRSIGVERVEVSGPQYKLVNADTVEETATMSENSVGLILTSIPFSTQYEYTPSYNDFGHSESNDEFFAQMDYLTPELLRVLQPGRMAAIHVKDRIVPGGMTGLGFQTVYPFHARCIEHYTKHGFSYMGMKTIVTDVVRENNQTYRLGWTEQCKDATKMGVGMPEYLLLFRKPQTNTEKSYADLPVVKSKERYSRSRWQIDAHGFARSSGNRLLMPEELDGLDHAAIFKLFRRHSLSNVYDFENHVAAGEALEQKGILPVTFMLLQPQSWSDDVWTDITRMLTLNGAQSAKKREMHLCPMQFDLADRVIAQLSMPGEVVFDPFGGLMTVPYRAVMAGRYGIGIELNARYFADGCVYVETAAQKIESPSLFDALEKPPSCHAEELCNTA